MLWLCFWLLFNARAYSPDGAVVDWTTAYLAPATRLPHAVEASAKGEASYRVPLDLPPARLGVPLALVYSSRGGLDGELPWGWSLDGLPEILAPNNPQAYADGEWILRGGPSGLLRCGSSGPCTLLSARAGEGVEATHDAASDTWTVVTDDGRTILVEPADAGAASGAPTSRWRATEITSPTGDVVTASYHADGRIDELRYGGNALTGDAETVWLRFVYDLPDRARVNVRGGFVDERAPSLIEIEAAVRVGGAWAPVRSWFLAWAVEGSQPLLTSITTQHTDGVSVVTDPPLTFEYSVWDDGVAWGGGGAFTGPNLGVIVSVEDGGVGRVVSSHRESGLVDLNGDGLLDHLASDGAGVWAVRWQTRAGGVARWSPSVLFTGPALYLDEWDHGFPNEKRQGVGLVDLDGDRLPDLIDAGSAPGEWLVYFGDGAGFSAPLRIPAPGLGLDRELTSNVEGMARFQALVDTDGDGWLDLVYLLGSGPATVWRHSGDPTLGYLPPVSVTAPWCDDLGADDFLYCGLSELSADSAAGVVTDVFTLGSLVDLNGDGRVDYVRAPGQATRYGAPLSAPWAVYYGDGEGWLPATYWEGPSTYALSWRFQGDTLLPKETFLALMDVNGDGLLDVVDAAAEAGPTFYPNLGDRLDTLGQPTPSWWMRGRRSLGVTEVVAVKSGRDVYWEHHDRALVADLTHDGALDSLHLNTKTYTLGPVWGLGLYPGPGLLISVENGAGQTTTLDYSPASDAWPSGDVSQAQSLAERLDLLTWMRIDDAVSGQHAETEITYRQGVSEDGALWGFVERVVETSGSVNQWSRVEESYQLSAGLPPLPTARETFTDGCLGFSPSLARCGTITPAWRLRESFTYTTLADHVLLDTASLSQRGDSGAIRARTIDYSYDSRGRLVLLRHDGGDGSAITNDVSVLLRYVDSGVLSRLTEQQLWGWDPLLRVWREHERTEWTYDHGALSQGLLTEWRQAAGHLGGVEALDAVWVGETFTHGPRGEVLEVTKQPTGERTRFTYDFGDAVVALTDDGLLLTETPVNALGERTGRYDLTNGLYEDWILDPAGRLTERWLTDALGVTTLLETVSYVDGAQRSQERRRYDEAGAVSFTEGQFFDGGGHTALLWSQLPGGGFKGERLSHDLWGRENARSEACLSPRPPTGPSAFSCADLSRRYYDPLGQLREHDRDVFEAGSVLLKHIDAWTAEREGEAKQKVRHAYDTFGRLVAVSEQLDGAWTTTATYEYAPTGQLVAHTDAVGERTTWSYDGARRLRRVESPAIGWREYDYDGDRLIQQQDSAGGWLQQRHDPWGRVIERAVSDPLLGVAVTVLEYDGGWVGKLSRAEDPYGEEVYAYDARGNLSQRERLWWDGEAASWAWVFDHHGEVTESLSPSGRSLEIEHDAGRAVAVREGGAPALELEWSAEGALVGVRHPGGAEMQSVVSPLGAVQEAILYGPSGLVAERRYQWRPDGLLKSVEDSTGLELFQYDSRGQLIRASGVWSEAYQYDARGAPTRQTEPSGKVWTTALGSGGRIVARSDGAVIERQHYDGAGQLTERHDGLGGVVKLRYDGAGRVRAIEEAGVLVLAIERNHTGEVVRRVYGDPADPSSPAEHSLGAWRRSPSGQVEESLTFAERAVARIVNGDWMLLLPDPGGTPEVVIDEHGAVRATRAWGVYGAQRSAVGVEARGLHGHRIEAGLGLLDAGARHLVGGLGQFGQVEPLLLEGPGGAMLLEPLRMSAYRYGLNAPTSFVDRDGRMVESPLDFMLSGYSVGKAILNPTKDNVVAAVVDVAAAATPFVPAVYGLGMRNADEVMEVINTFGKVSDPAATAVKAAPPIGAVPVGAGAASRPVRNAHLAGKSHPVTGIPFDSAGFPDFSSVSQANVQITYSGSRTADFAAANKAAGLQSTPKGMTWHHHQDGTTMQLVPTDIHSATGHTGGFSLP
ncbi:HNH endonuclease [Myxococcota bacterium]|nr:HNH endonuclease [Myxococcota bacterium]